MLRIVIADDENTARDNMIECIDWESHGITIIGIASDGKSALDIILSKKPDIVLIDIKMPKLSGLEVIQKVHEHSIYPSFIIISGYDDFEYAQQAIQLGVNGYLLKPFRPKDIFNTILNSINTIYPIKQLKNLEGFLSFANNYTHNNFNPRQLISYPAEEERRIINCILTLSLESAIQALDKFIMGVKSINNDAYQIFHCYMLLYTEIFRLVIESGKSFQKNYFDYSSEDCSSQIEHIERSLYLFIQEAHLLLNRIYESNQALSLAVKYIEEHYSEDLSLEEVSQNVYVSTSYLSRLFSINFNMGFVKYVQKVRIEHAKKLLASPQWKVKDVAKHVGFTDPKYFSRIFKKHTGIMPSQFKLLKNFSD